MLSVNRLLVARFLAAGSVLMFAISPVYAQATILRQPAQVEPYERANIFAKASGFVSAVHVDIGDQVKKGTLLAELAIPEMDQELLRQEALVEQAAAAILQAESHVTYAAAKLSASQAALEAVRAQLEKYRADIVFARSELKRITSLVSSRSVNAAMQDEKQQQLRSAEAAFGVAEAQARGAEANVLVAVADQQRADADLVFARYQRKVAEASLAQTLALVAYAKIYAPFDGMISQRGIDTGDFVLSAASAKGESLFTLNRVDRFRIVFDVPESSAAGVVIGQPASLKLDSIKDHEFSGQVKRTTGELDSRTRTLRVEAEVRDDARQLRAGMYGMVTISLKEE